MGTTGDLGRDYSVREPISREKIELISGLKKYY